MFLFRARWLVLATLSMMWIVLWAGHEFHSGYLALATQIQDDTYYYLLPAWNFTRLGRFTFDGQTLAYGFQPLWEILLTVAAAASHSREFFLRLALFIGALCYASTAIGAARVAILVWRSANREGGAVLAATVAGTTLLLNTPVQLSNLTGKENALYGLLLVILLNLHLDDRLGRSRHLPIISGAVAGLILLARLTPMSLAIVAVQPFLIRWFEGRTRFIVKYGISAALTLLPWLTYAKIALGFALPSSVHLNANVMWELIASSNRPALSTVAAVAGEYLISCCRFALGLESHFWPASHQHDAMGPVVVPLLALSGITWALLAKVRDARSGSTTVNPARYILAVLVTVIAASVVIPVALSNDRLDLYYRRWYVVELPIVAAILTGLGAEATAQVAKRLAPMIGRMSLIGVIAAWILVGGRETIAIGKPVSNYRDEGQWQQVTLRATDWSNRELHLTQSDHVGAFSAGLLGWFSNATVINLDGLANNEVARLLLARKSIRQYCIERQIRFYIDAVTPAEVFGGYSVKATFPNGSLEYPVYYVAEVSAQIRW